MDTLKLSRQCLADARNGRAHWPGAVTYAAQMKAARLATAARDAALPDWARGILADYDGSDDWDADLPDGRTLQVRIVPDDACYSDVTEQWDIEDLGRYESPPDGAGAGWHDVRNERMLIDGPGRRGWRWLSIPREHGADIASAARGNRAQGMARGNRAQGMARGPAWLAAVEQQRRSLDHCRRWLDDGAPFWRVEVLIDGEYIDGCGLIYCDDYAGRGVAPDILRGVVFNLVDEYRAELEAARDRLQVARRRWRHLADEARAVSAALSAIPAPSTCGAVRDAMRAAFADACDAWRDVLRLRAIVGGAA